jgi:hypothetical protein
MKQIKFINSKKQSKIINSEKKNDLDNVKVREKYKNIKNIDVSNNVFLKLNSIYHQKDLINKLYMGCEFIEKKFLLNELSCKINSYKSQDIKKDYHELKNLITLDDIIVKLVSCKLKCYYCNDDIKILYKESRDKKQWTLDRLNNYDEHTNLNTIISCLECNLQRRRKNSEKFKFTKQLENKNLQIKKLE